MKYFFYVSFFLILLGCKHRYDRCSFFYQSEISGDIIKNELLGIHIKLPQDFVLLSYKAAEKLIKMTSVDIMKSNDSVFFGYDFQELKRNAVLFNAYDTTSKKQATYFHAEVAKNLVTPKGEYFHLNEFVSNMKPLNMKFIESDVNNGERYIFEFKNKHKFWWYYVKYQIPGDDYFNYCVIKNYNKKLAIVFHISSLYKDISIEELLDDIYFENWNDKLNLKAQIKSCY